MTENNEKILKRAAVSDDETEQVAGGHSGGGASGAAFGFISCKTCGKQHKSDDPKCCYCNSYCHASADCPDAPHLDPSSLKLDPEKNIWGL